MYIILVYDVHKKVNHSVFKICKQYLLHIQNSVFEGELSLFKLNELKNKLTKVIKKEDLIYLYSFDSMKYASKTIIGNQPEESNLLL